jgi:carotenoid cleavage dioxygenase-like enzyme
MMHDFGVSEKYTVLMDLPLSLDPFNLLRNKAVVTYDPTIAARFGVFPRYEPSNVRWFEADPCCIFHTANTWDGIDASGHCTSVNLLVCRLTSPAPIFAAGNVGMPRTTAPIEQQTQTRRPPFFERYDYDSTYVQTNHGKIEVIEGPVLVSDGGFECASALESRPEEMGNLGEDSVSEEEQCRLFFYQFDLDQRDCDTIRYQFALSNIPFEFPTAHPMREMSAARYIYGCSTSTASFNVALGRAVKIDTLVKVDALALIAQGKQDAHLARTGCVDRRTVTEIVKENRTNSEDLIKCYKMPNGWYAQEARLVPRANAHSEDDGYLLFYAFDESQLDKDGNCPDTAASELWVLDAKTMKDVLCRVRLPQRVPYGFHGNFFTEQQISRQRTVSSFRELQQSELGIFRTLHDFFIGLVA